MSTNDSGRSALKLLTSHDEAGNVRTFVFDSDHAIVRNGLLTGDVPFLQKPFAPDRLAHKVREVLNSRR